MHTEQVQLRCPLGQHDIRHFRHLERREEVAGVLVLPDESSIGKGGEGLKLIWVWIQNSWNRSNKFGAPQLRQPPFLANCITIMITVPPAVLPSEPVSLAHSWLLIQTRRIRFSDEGKAPSSSTATWNLMMPRKNTHVAIKTRKSGRISDMFLHHSAASVVRQWFLLSGRSSKGSNRQRSSVVRCWEGRRPRVRWAPQIVKRRHFGACEQGYWGVWCSSDGGREGNASVQSLAYREGGRSWMEFLKHLMQRIVLSSNEVAE